MVVFDPHFARKKKEHGLERFGLGLIFNYFWLL
jgi:hypothetical protein